MNGIDGHDSLTTAPDTEHAPTGLASTGQAIEPVPLSRLLTTVDTLAQRGETGRFEPVPLGFTPLDDIIAGGLRSGDLMVVGGASGVGKTIFGLQLARNVVAARPDTEAMYVCYEHDAFHLMSRLLCLESAQDEPQALTLKQVSALMGGVTDGASFLNRLADDPRYRPMLARITSYADRLHLVKASGLNSTMDQLGEWARSLRAGGRHGVMVVDYLQKIPVDMGAIQVETEVTTFLSQNLKELAMDTGIRIVAIAASDRAGLQAKRMRFSDLRGSSALQYEADVGLILHNKFDIVSREHMVYNLTQAGAMREWIVVSVEKNRVGRAAVDMEYRLDAPHFRFHTNGGFVHERLIDDRLTLA